MRLPQQARRELDAPMGEVLHGRQAEIRCESLVQR
jgi:uncharacterized protein (UPF0218 family)